MQAVVASFRPDRSPSSSTSTTSLVQTSTAPSTPMAATPTPTILPSALRRQSSMSRRLSLFRARATGSSPKTDIQLVRDCALPARGDDGPDAMSLSHDLEDRWNQALSRAPSRCGVSQVDLPEELERRWAEALDRAPTVLPDYFARLLPADPAYEGA